MLFNLQALRGIAALLVVMHHSLAHFNAMGLSNPVFEFIARHGNIGVDIFFVISGYVMAKTTAGSGHGPDVSRYFLGKRFARIYLGYWPVFLLALAIYQIHSPEYLADKQLLQSFTLLKFGNYAGLVITPAWSLTFELYFYLIVGLMLTAKWIRPIPVFLLISVLIVLKSVFTRLGDNDLLDFFFSPYIYEFIAGYFICHYWRYLAARHWIWVALLAGATGLSAGVQLGDDHGYWRFTAIALFSASLVWLMLLLEEHALVTFHGLVKKVGDSSYTLYLTHTVLLGLFYSLGMRDYLVAHGFALSGFIACIVFITVISWVFYIYVEAPLYRWVKSRLKKS
jgi:exopolysaccharide production protein ExoZ